MPAPSMSKVSQPNAPPTGQSASQSVRDLGGVGAHAQAEVAQHVVLGGAILRELVAVGAGLLARSRRGLGDDVADAPALHQEPRAGSRLHARSRLDGEPQPRPGRGAGGPPRLHQVVRVGHVGGRVEDADRLADPLGVDGLLGDVRRRGLGAEDQPGGGDVDDRTDHQLVLGGRADDVGLAPVLGDDQAGLLPVGLVAPEDQPASRHRRPRPAGPGPGHRPASGPAAPARPRGRPGRRTRRP